MSVCPADVDRSVCAGRGKFQRETARGWLHTRLNWKIRFGLATWARRELWWPWRIGKKASRLRRTLLNRQIRFGADVMTPLTRGSDSGPGAASQVYPRNCESACAKACLDPMSPEGSSCVEEAASDLCWKLSDDQLSARMGYHDARGLSLFNRPKEMQGATI